MRDQQAERAATRGVSAGEHHGAAIEPPALSTEHGMASYYGNSFAGRPTASGEPYRPSALTAAHRTLPLGAVVRVTRVDRDGRPVAAPRPTRGSRP